MSADGTPRASIVAIGDELLAGAHPDLNSPFLAARLSELGWHVREVRVHGDDEDELVQCLRELATTSDLVLTSGGLGPTLDDVTRHAVARAAGVELESSDEALRQLRDWFAQSGRPYPASNDRQALVPAGAEILPNRRGTAPGFRLPLGRGHVCSLPGPPPELRDMYMREVEPHLGEIVPAVAPPRRAKFHLIGMSESLFADLAGDWMRRGADSAGPDEPLMGVTAKLGVLNVHLRSGPGGGESALAAFEARLEAFRERFDGSIFSETEADPARVLAERLIARGITVTAAESCTGGMLMAELTKAPGLSAVLGSSFVTYAEEAKTRWLGVPPELIEREGVVSTAVARAMAEGAARASGARLALAVTGVAGPTGGTEACPVGTVAFASAFDGQTRVSERRFPDVGRDAIRRWATTWSLGMGLQAIGDPGPVADPGAPLRVSSS